MQVSQFTVIDPDPDHSGFLAEVILAASRSQLEQGPFDLAFQAEKDELLALLEWMVLSDHVTSCHYSNFLIAEIEGKPIGALSLFDPSGPEVLPLGAALADACEGLGYEGDYPDQALRRLEALQRCLAPARRATWTIEWVAVAPTHRRLGIAGRLLGEAIAKTRSAGAEQLQVSTYVDNAAAIAAYQKAGFTALQERRDPAVERLLGTPGLVELIRDVGTA